MVDLAVEAALKAIEDSSVDPRGIDKIIIANAASPFLLRQSHLAPLIVDHLGLSGKPAVSIEAANASGAMALHMGLKEVLAGSENVLVVGVEKLSDNKNEDVIAAVSLAEDWEFLAGLGVTSEAIQGIMARHYMSKYGAPHENIALVPTISHNHAAKSPHAMYPFPTKVEKVLRSPLYADPLHLLEIAGRGDGAAAVILSSERGSVEILASSIGTDRFRIFEREDLLYLKAVSDAAQDAYEKAKISISDVNVLELHDTTSIMGVLELEALGFAERGAGHKLLEDGVLDLNGKWPTNTFGGSKARGDPLGATGVYQAVEIYKQLIGEAGFNQIDNAKIGLSLTIGGIASTAVINVFKRRD
jgi:acetyl-CoA acetyltransferase